MDDKKQDLTYKDNAELYEKVEDIPGEKAMLQLAAARIKAFSLINTKNSSQGITILDFCCGTSLILEQFDLHNNNHIYSITGVDISKEYLDFAKAKYFPMLGYQSFTDAGIRLDFVQHDAVDYQHKEKTDAIICSSAYHHIEDERKLLFLANVKKHLKEDGIAVFCENFIRDFNDEEDYFDATREFYDARIRELIEMGITDVRLQLLERVKQYGLDKEYEYKTSLRIFKEHLKIVGFDIIEIEKVWPQKDYFLDEEIGDFVIVAKINRDRKSIMG